MLGKTLSQAALLPILFNCSFAIDIFHLKDAHLLKKRTETEAASYSNSAITAATTVQEPDPTTITTYYTTSGKTIYTTYCPDSSNYLQSSSATPAASLSSESPAASFDSSIGFSAGSSVGYTGSAGSTVSTSSPASAGVVSADPWASAALSSSTTSTRAFTPATSTIFLATIAPESIPAGITAYFPVASRSNPVTCGPKLIATLTYSINTSTITTGCTISATQSAGTSVVEPPSTFSTTGFVTSLISSTSAAIAESTSTEGTLTLAPSSDSDTVSSSSSSPTAAASDSGSTVDLFVPISTDKPPSNFKEEDLNFNLPDGVSNDGGPIQTNKFYANLFLGSQTQPAFTYPYSVWWESSNESYNGLGVSHTTADQLVFGENTDESQGGAPRYYINPGKILSILFSAESFGEEKVALGLNNMTTTSTLLTLYDNSTSDDSSNIQFPLVQGMGFVTGIYSGGLTAQLKSQVGFSSFEQVTSDDIGSNTLKYRATLNNKVSWLIYATLPSSNDDFSLGFENSVIKASSAVDGLIIQVAVAPDSNQESYYDSSAGLYVTDAFISGYASESGDSATYSISYNTEGSSKSNSPIIFALHHHLGSLSSETSSHSTNISLFSTTKGDQYAYQTNKLTFNEDLESSKVGYLPYSTLVDSNDQLSYTSDQVSLLAESANHEFSIDIVTTIKSLSTYYAGKYIDKFSYIVLVAHEIIQDDDFTKSSLSTVKEAFDAVFNGQLAYQLMYDTKLKGVTSDAAQAGDPNEDFGAPYYNDHHFHYGYFLHAAAVVGYVDSKFGGSWAEDHKDFINALARDVNNPSTDDTYFPVSRSFDWYHGHSWAAGLFEAADGKNQESTSEDFNFAYGLKTWGKTIGDKAMELRGDLMISIMKRSLNDYYYYTDDNKVQPSKFLPNRVAGILFDNKIDHTTYFGTNPEYIHGIHMLPTNPISSIIRGPEYTKLEWDDTLESVIGGVKSGWTGILRLNQALFDPKSSYDFFSQDNFDDSYLDDGLSRTWGLAYSGGINNLYSS